VTVLGHATVAFARACCASSRSAGSSSPRLQRNQLVVDETNLAASPHRFLDHDVDRSRLQLDQEDLGLDLYQLFGQLAAAARLPETWTTSAP